jgi:hypothetical protein
MRSCFGGRLGAEAEPLEIDTASSWAEFSTHTLRSTEEIASHARRISPLLMEEPLEALDGKVACPKVVANLRTPPCRQSGYRDEDRHANL